MLAPPPLSDPLLSLGESFAQKILANEASSAKFGFLKDDDPYHTYYRERVKAAAAGVDLSTTTLAPAAPAANASASDKAKAAAAASKMTVVSSVGAGGGDGGKAEPIAPPPPDAYAVPVPAGLTPHELDALRLTAACVARNGGSFAAGLADREAANPAFAFLRATHSLHPFSPPSLRPTPASWPPPPTFSPPCAGTRTTGRACWRACCAGSSGRK